MGDNLTEQVMTNILASLYETGLSEDQAITVIKNMRQRGILFGEKDPETMLKSVVYTRKRFDVDAVQVTKENLSEVATWCGGTIIGVKNDKTGLIENFVKVPVTRVLHERQGMAGPGDWVLRASGKSYKVYTPRAFELNFELAPQSDDNYGEHLNSGALPATPTDSPVTLAPIFNNA